MAIGSIADVDDLEIAVTAVRWCVVGVLFDDAVTTIPSTQPHALPPVAAAAATPPTTGAQAGRVGLTRTQPD